MWICKEDACMAPPKNRLRVALATRAAGLSSTATRGVTLPKVRPPCWMASIAAPLISQAMPALTGIWAFVLRGPINLGSHMRPW